jgi:hypothetical protein
MAEPGDNAGDDFSVSMLADQHVRPRSPIAHRDHQLLGVPKGKHDVTSFPVQGIDRLMAPGLAAHGPEQDSDQGGRDRRQQRAGRPTDHPFSQAGLLLSFQHSALIIRSCAAAS